MPNRVIAYVDGFNFYQAVDELKKPHLKWVNLRSVANSFLRPNQKLEAVGKGVLVATPPKRFGRARSLSPNLEVTQGRVAKNLLPEKIVGVGGEVLARRPSEYAPPA